MGDIWRVQYLTKNYVSLQGLRWIPMGLYFLIEASGWMGRQGDLTWRAPVLAGLMILYYWIGVLYKRILGSIHTKMNPKELITAIIIIGSLFLANYIDVFIRAPFAVFGLALAVLSLILFWKQWPYGFHYLISAILLALISLLPLEDRLTPFTGMFYLVFGVYCLIIGIINHLLLIRLMRPIPKE